MFPETKISESEARRRFEAVSRDDVLSALRAPVLDGAGFLALLSPAALECRGEIAECAAAVRFARFGKTVKLYTPLYISNYCVNQCVYCGFNAASKAPRRRLSLEELDSELSAISEFGVDSVLLVSGEDPRAVSLEYLKSAVAMAKKRFSYLAVEIYPLDEFGYSELRQAGLDGLTLYQETYDRETYARLHPAGPKADYDARLRSVEAGAKAGLSVIGLGTLLGLYDWRIEALSLAAHALWLKRRYWKIGLQFSFPRITPIKGGFDVPAPVSEEELETMVLAFRLFFPDAEISISTRENRAFREKIAVSAATTLSAASKVVPGGYADTNTEELGQFSLRDTRSVDAMAHDLAKLDLEVVFKDWDPAFSRTGSS